MGNAATKRSFRKSLFALTLGASYGMLCAGQAGALPGTPTVQGTGIASFTPGLNSLTVNQTSQNLAIVWTPNAAGNVPLKAFDILSGETVTFMQPSTSAVAYNSISCSGCSATIIAGTLRSRLTSNPTLVGGSVWLFDPNGIVIGQGAVVNVGGFIASSLQGDIPTWLANPNNPLTINDGGGATPTNGAVTNDGNITASNGVLGYVALIGNSVAATQTGATGTIDVGFGSINLAAGRVATITALNGGGLNFALSTAAGDAINVNNGTATSAVAVTGPAALTGAAVTLSANVAAALFTNAVNTSGVIRAVNMDSSGGTIKLVGAGSPVLASGTLDASGATGADPVGTVQITGDSVSLGATTVGGALTVEATTGGITQSGAVAAGAATFTTDTANQTIVLGGANTFSGAVSLNTTGATGNASIVADTLNLGTSTVGGALSATSGTGDITESGVLTAGTGSSFTSAANINLSTQANDLKNPAFVLPVTSANLGYRDINSIVIPATNLHGGNITLISDTGTITQGGAINAAAGTFTTSGNNETITLGAANTFSGAVSLNTTGASGNATIAADALNLGTSTVGGTLTGTAATGGVTESGVVTAAGGNFTASTASQAINLATEANNFTGPVLLNTSGTGTASISSASLNLGTSNVGGTLTATTTGVAPAAGITESGVLTAATGSSFTSATNIDLSTQANDLKNPAFAFTGPGGTGNLGYRDINSILLPATNLNGGNITLISDTGTIGQGGAINAAAGTFTTSGNNETITLGAANTFSGAVSLNTTGATGDATISAAVLNLGTSTVGGTLTATATGVAGLGITESGVLTAGTGSSFTSATNINLGTQANDLNNPTFVFTGATGNLGYRDVNSILLPATNLNGGNITLISDTGTIGQGGAINAAAGTFTTSTADKAITLGAANTFSGAVSLNTTGTGTATIVAAALDLGTSTVGGALTATATGVAGLGITESGVLTAGTGSSFTSATNINLGTQANDLNNPTFVFTGATGNLGYRDVNSILLPATNLNAGNITLISDTGTIGQGGAINAAAGTFTTSTADKAITLGAANTFSGVVSLNTTGTTGNATIVASALNLGTSTIGGALTATATGVAPGLGITESGVLTAAAGSSFTSATNIDLSTQANDLKNPAFAFTGSGGTGNLGYRDINSILLPATNLNGGNITLISDTGTISQGGAIVAAAGTFTTSRANETITLGAANTFSGAVSLNTTGASGNAIIVAHALDFGASNVGGALTAEATTGGISQTGAIAAGAAIFTADTANQTITLGAANTFSGAVSLNTTGAAGNAIIDAGALNFGVSNVGGTLTGTAATGGIAQTGAITAGGGSFTADTANQSIALTNPANAFAGAVSLNTTGATGNATIDAGALNFGASNVGGTLTGTAATGGITQTGAITAGGGSFTTSAAGQAIALTTPTNAFAGAVSLNTTGAAGNASIDADALNLGTSNVGGTLTATSVTGGITESGVLTAPTSSFTSAANINLGTQANVLPSPTFTFTGGTGNLGLREFGAISTPAIAVPGSITLISDTGAITETGAIVATAGTFTTSAANGIDLSTQTNTFTGAVSLNTGTGPAAIEAAALNFGVSNVGGALTAIATTGTITQTGVLTAGGGSFTTAAANQAITLGAANTFSGAVSLNTTGAAGNATIDAGALNFGTSTVGGALTGTAATGSITQTGAITAGGGSFTTNTANQSIVLTDPANAFAGAVALNTTGATGNATIDAGALTFGASNVGGALTAEATTGGISQTGAIAAGAATFTTDTANQTITLGAANTFSGAVALNTTGAAGNATIDAGALNFGVSNVGGTLTGTAATGGITQTGAITAGGGSFTTDTANQSIALTTPANAFAGAVSLNTTGATGNATIDAGALNFGVSNVGGALTAEATTGGIAQTGTVAAGAATFTTDTANQTIALATPANTFSGAVSLNTTGTTGNATIDAAALNLGTSNVGGTLTATGASGVTESGVLTAPASSFASAGSINLSTQANNLPGAAFSLTGTSGNLAFQNTGNINLAATMVPGSITLMSDTGSITQAGAIAATTGTFTTSLANQTINLGAANNFSGAVSLNTSGATGNATIDAAALNLGASNVGGTLTASGAGGITESGVLTAPTSSFASAGSINLLTQANNLPGAAFALTGTSGNLAFQNSGNINQAAITVPGSVTLTSDTGSITQAGAISATAGSFTTSAANKTITLSAANKFSGAVSLHTTGAAGNATIDAAALNFGASNIGGTLTGTAATGSITETGAITAAGGSFTTSTANQTITLGAANTFSGAVSLNTTGAAGNATIEAAALNFGASTIGGGLTGTAATGGITESGVLTAAGASVFSALTANQGINLATQTNNFTGTVALNTLGTGSAAIKSQSLDLGASSVGGTLTATSTVGDITESGVLDPTSSVFTSAGNINLGTQANVLGNVTFVFTGAAGNLNFRDAGAINMAAITVPGSITLTSDTGSISETGAISASTGTFTTSAANQGINLGTQTNAFTGAVSLNTQSGGNAAIKEAALNLGTSTVGGTLTATSTTGSITESGLLTAAGGSTFTSAANIDLSTQTNVLGGTVVAAATNGFVNVNAAQFATVDAVAKNDITLNAATGDLDHLSALTFAGNVIATAKGNMTVDGADAALTSATGNVTLTAGGTISQAVAYNAIASGAGLTSNDISIRGSTVTLSAPNLGSGGNFVGIIANNLTTANSTPSNLFFAVLTPSGQKIAPANLKINGLSALPVTPGVFVTVKSMPQTEFNIGSPAYLNFVKNYETAPTFDLGAGQVQTSAESLASALNVAANSQQGTSSVNGILGSTPDANISLFNIVGLCLPADQRDDEEAAKHKDCLPAKTTDNRLPKRNPLSDALPPVLLASRSAGSAAAQELR